MRIKTSNFIIGLIVFTFLILSATALYSQNPINQQPSEDDWWLPDYVDYTENSGCIFYGPKSDYYYKDNIEIVYVRWKDINPQEGIYNWSELIDSLNGGLDIHFRMDLSDSIHVPQWLFAKYPNLSDSLLQIGSGYTDVFGDYSPSMHIPFWHTGVAEELENLRIEFDSQNFASHPKLHHIYFPFSYDYGEYERPNEIYFDQANMSPQDYLDWFYSFTDDWIDVFNGNKHKLVYTGADTDEIFNSEFWRDSIGRKLSEYIVQNGLSARTGLVEKFNFVHTDLPNYGSALTNIEGKNYLVTDENNTLIGDALRIWADENEEFCFASFPCDYYHYKQSILRRLQLRMNWMYTNDNSYEIDTSISKYHDLTAGKNIDNSPDAWCALRSSTDAYIGWTYYPDSQNVAIHNWEKYLFQRDVQPNGNTKPTYMIDGDLYRLFNRISYEAKQTDLVNGNNYIYFDLDDRFLNGGSNHVQMKITYLDNFSGTWNLEYTTDNDSYKSVNITNQNDNDWKTITLIIQDASFDNSQLGNMDFRLFNGGSNDLIVRFVRVIKLEEPLNPIPLGLISFQGEKLSDNLVKLNWETQNEIKVSGFEIQKRGSNNAWKSIAFVKSKEVLNTTNLYELLDTTKEETILYYRLKTIDVDQSHEYSDIIAIDMGISSTFSIFPTIAEDVFTIAGNRTNCTISIYDLNGIERKSFSMTDPSMEVDISNFPVGMYFIVIRSNQNQIIESQRVLKK